MIIEGIISAYINGDQLSDTERQQLREWMGARPENDRFVARLEKLKVDPAFRARLEGEYEKTFASLWRDVREKGRRHRRRRAIYRTASVAVAVAVIAAAIIGSRWMPDSNEPQNFLGNTAPGTSKAILELADGRRVELTPDRSDVIEDNGMHISISGSEVIYADKGESDALIYNSIIVPRTGEHKVILGDGTSVWLNSESSLRYPQAFAGRERRVFLSGEAYFEVSHNKDMPFVVETRGQELTVLGTEFNIYAYPRENRVLSTLVSGSVKIDIKNTERELILNPGQQAVLDEASGNVNIMDVDIAEVTTWKDGFFSLERMSLEEIVNMLSRWYDVPFEFKDDAARSLTFKGSLPRYDDLTKVLTSLEEISPVEFKYRKDVIAVGME